MNIPGAVTGVRVSDFVCLIFFFILAVERKLSFRYKKKEFFLFFILIISFCISTINGVVNTGSVIGVIVPFRFLSYALMGYYTLEVISKVSKLQISGIYVFCLTAALFQYLLILPNYNPGFGSLLYSREFSASFPTPAEYSYFFAIFGLIVLSRLGAFLPATVTFINLFNGVWATATFLMAYIVRFRYGNASVLFLVILAAGSYFVGLSDIVRFLRMIYEMSSQSVEYENLKEYWSNEFENMTLGHRVGKWSGAISLTLSDVNSTLFGFGTYSARGALDGGLVRLFFEHGFVGFILVLVLAWLASVHFLTVFVFANLFFDGFISSTVSPLLFAFYLLERRKKYNRE